MLEIGTGCGYQAAVLAELVRQVTTIERIPEVAGLARANLAAIGIKNVEVIVGDGTLGYPTKGPIRRNHHHCSNTICSPATYRTTG